MVIISGFQRKLLRVRILLHIYKQAKRVLGSHGKAMAGLKKLQSLRTSTHGKKYIPKIVKVDGRYFIGLNVPGWPSEAFNSFFDIELRKLKGEEGSANKLQSVIFSITARCSYFCEHCYEWENISSKELLSYEELRLIQDKLHNYGVSHVQLSGGEPMARMDDLIRLLNERQKESDYWILTSGHELTGENAGKLKEAGLTGAVVSLDHWDEESHNSFRKNPKAFYWVREAIKNCNEAGIVTALSICATKEFISDDNLQRFSELAAEWKVGFIRVLEPRAVGRYSGQKVLLNGKEKRIIENFFTLVNYETEFRNYPIIMYPGFHQKNIGCMGSGNRYLYIDSRGDTHACPFCQGSVGSALKEDLPELVGKLKVRGCHMFATGH